MKLLIVLLLWCSSAYGEYAYFTGTVQVIRTTGQPINRCQYYDGWFNFWQYHEGYCPLKVWLEE